MYTIIRLTVLLLFILILTLLYGCTPLSVVPDMSPKENDTLTEGCCAVEAKAKLGMVNSGGGMEMCKLICSPHLPPDFYYNYENRGCNARVGNHPEGR